MPKHPSRPRPSSRSESRWLPVVLALSGLACSAVAASAQEYEDLFLLPGIVVTATQVPVDRNLLPTPVTVLTREDLQEQGLRTVGGALRTVPGIHVVRSGSAGAQTSIFMRGGESDYVKVLVDGVPINEAGGAIDIADLSTDQIERIEVVRGPVGVLYGSDAVTGVVQIFTLRGRGSPRLEVTALGGMGEQRYESGRYPLVDGGFALSGDRNDLSYSIGGGRSWTEGAYPLNNEYSLHTTNARVGWTSASETRFALATRFSDSESGFPTDGSGNLVDENQAVDRRLWTTSAEAATRVSPRLELQLQLGHTAREQVVRDEPDSPADTLGVFASHFHTELTRSSADLRLNAALSQGMLTLGAVRESTSGETTYSSESEWGPTTAEADYSRANTAAYLQLLTPVATGLQLTGGLRMDHNETFGRFDTYRLGLSWHIHEGTRIRGAAGRAFREPTFAENFGSGFDTGNPELVPERTRSWEVGAEQAFGRLRVEATAFRQTFRDLVQYTFATEDPAGPNYVNVGAAESRGIELSGEADLGPVSLSGSYTHLRTRVLDPGLTTDKTFAQGQPLLRRPGHTGNLAGRFFFEQGSIHARLHLTGEREDLDFGQGFPAPRVTLPAHATLDLAAEHALPGGLGSDARLLIQVENTFDKRYESVAGFPALGRVVRIGVRMGFGG